ncbi:MAG: hypothetical protein CMP10_18300 [Zetaproteobacteria bacterium]|mgnify:CR=1 FL=1|nr:hypothetical protein [Pseudobdellovibrionaceae bacterium]
MFKINNLGGNLIISVMVFCTFGCNEKKSEEEAVATNELAAAYPGGLAVSFFPQDSGNSLTLDASKIKTVAAKKKEAENLINGTAASCLPTIFSESRTKPNVTCYEFDQEMLYGTNPSNQTYGTRDGKNTGTDEACLVAFARSQVMSVEDILDKTLGLVQGMMCQAKKDGTASELPAVGETIDLKTALNTAMGTQVSSVTAASIKRLADQNDRPVYRTDITTTKDSETRELHMVHSPGSASDNTIYDGLVWSKITGFNDPFGDGGGGSQPTDPYFSIRYSQTKNDSGAYTMQAELMRANIDSQLATNAFVNGVLDLNVGADFTVSEDNNNYGRYKKPDGSYYSQDNDAVAGITYIAFNLNPATNAGTLSYWQNPGGSYSENARGMVFALAADSYSSALSGCGTSGALSGSASNAMSIRKGKKGGSVFTPGGFYHPALQKEQTSGPAGTCTDASATDDIGTYYSRSGCYPNSVTIKWYIPNSTDLDATLLSTWTTKQMGSVISRQCVKQASTSGSYALDSMPAAGFELLDPSAGATSDKTISAPVLSSLVSFTVE